MVARSFWFDADAIERETHSPIYGRYIDSEMFNILLPENILGKSKIKKYPTTVDIYRGDIDPTLVMNSYSWPQWPDYRVDGFLVKTGSKAFVEALTVLVKSESVTGYLTTMDFSWDKRRRCFCRREDEVAFLIWKYSIRKGTIYPVVGAGEEEDWDKEGLKAFEKIGWSVSEKPVFTGLDGLEEPQM